MDDLSPNQANRLSGAQGYWGTAFVLALIAHGLLFVLLFVSMQWRSEPTGPVYAELWNGDMPAAEAPAETQPEPQPEPEPEPQSEPEPQPEPQPEPEPAPEPPAPEEPQQQLPPPPPPIAQTDLDRQANLLEDPDIVQERLDREKKKQEEEKQRILERERQLQEAKRAEEQRKAEEARQAELRRQEEERRIEEQKRQEELKKQEEQKRLAEEKRKAEEKAEAERKIAEEKAQREKALAEKRKAQEELNRQRAQEQANAARRKEMLSRLTGQSGSAMGSGSGAMTNFQQAQYNNRIVACIRPHITFNTPAGAKRGMYVAKFDVRLLKNGQKAVPPKMISSSGLKAFDTAVEKAILMCNPFPKPPVGDIPSSITLTFDPVDDANGR